MKKFIIGFIVILLSACTLGTANTPREKVVEFLDKYKNQNSDIISQLEQTIKNDIANSDYHDRYKTLMTNQYKNMEYEIKEEIIEENNAVVEVEVIVYDYGNAIRNANQYLNENPNEFTKDYKSTIEDKTDNDLYNENSADETTRDTDNRTIMEYDEDKFMDYKLKEMEKVTDRVNYTIQFTLTKVNEEWQLDTLSNTDIEKLHGTYTS